MKNGQVIIDLAQFLLGLSKRSRLSNLNPSTVHEELAKSIVQSKENEDE